MRPSDASEPTDIKDVPTSASTPRGERKGYVLVAVLYLLGLCMGALDMSIVNPARTVIQNSLSIDDSLGVWILTIYTLAYAVSIPIMGKLADRHGRKLIYLLCIFLFGAGSALCGLAQDLGSFELLIGARVIQALGGGGIMPVATAEIGTAFPEEKRGMALGIVGMIYGMASIFGPSIGSLILDIFGQDQWQFIFYVNIPICLIVLIIGIIKLPDSREDEVKPIDGLGIILLTLMTLSLMIGLKNINFFEFAESITSLDVWPYLVAFTVLLPLFIVRERHAADPILSLRYFTDINILITLLCAILSGIIMMGTIFYPQFCENALFLKSGSGGYLIALLGLGSGVGAMTSGKLIDRFGVRPVLAVGFIGAMAGSLFMAFVACSWPNVVTVCTTLILTGLGLGFTMGAPLNYMMLQNTTDAESNSALATLSLMRSIGTAVAPSIMVAFIVHASMFMQDNLMEAMPDEVSVSPLPYAEEIDQKIEDIRSTEQGKKMLDGIDIPSLSDMTHIEMNMSDVGKTNSSVKVSPEALQELQDSDVTTIVSACKTMSFDMFSQLKPELIEEAQDGLSQGITSMQESLDEMDASLLQMKQMQAGSGHAGMTMGANPGTGMGTEATPSMDAAVGQLSGARDKLAETVSQLKEARDAVPALFDEAEANYAKAIDDDAASIQATYQQTLDDGFRNMAIFVSFCALIGALLLLPYKEIRPARTETETKGETETQGESEAGSKAKEE